MLEFTVRKLLLLFYAGTWPTNLKLEQYREYYKSEELIVTMIHDPNLQLQALNH